MIKFENLSLLRGGKYLLEKSNLTIHRGHRIGLTGRNGCGKSSLFALLCGTLQPEYGSATIARGVRIAHMAQEVEALEQSALEYVLDGDSEFRLIQSKIAQAELLGNDAQLAQLYLDYEQCGGYSAVSRAEQLLHGLGIEQERLQGSVKSFSGGWRMRINLARTLMSPSDLLLLDEPTNHLDLETIIWLEKWLLTYQGTLIIISHDRDFLDAVATHIVHIEHKLLNIYTGGYSAFEKLRADKLLLQQASFDKQEKQRSHLESFVRRFKAKASKARQAQSRMKALDRLNAAAPAYADSPFTFSFCPPAKLSMPLLSLRKASLGYNDQTILTEVSLSLQPGQCIGLLGTNGSGKSTLLKALSGADEMFQAGSIVKGEHLKVGYFSQHQLEHLDQKVSPMVMMQRLAPLEREQVLRDFLGSFNFYGDKALQPAGSFSGGEQARLSLALIVWQKPNLLLLDEPTNHLDLDVRHAITVSLQGFAGCIVLVSHDRHFLRHVTGEFMLIHQHKLIPFEGDLGDYGRWLNQENKAAAKKSGSDSRLLPADKSESCQEILSTADRRSARKVEAEKRKRLQPFKKRIQELEAQMEKSQMQLRMFEEQMQDVNFYQENREKCKKIIALQAGEKQHHQQLEESWFEACEALEKAEKES